MAVSSWPAASARVRTSLKSSSSAVTTHILLAFLKSDDGCHRYRLYCQVRGICRCCRSATSYFHRRYYWSHLLAVTCLSFCLDYGGRPNLAYSVVQCLAWCWPTDAARSHGAHSSPASITSSSSTCWVPLRPNSN